MMYLLYRLGRVIANSLSRESTYRIASMTADAHFYTSKKDREAVMKNLAVICGIPIGDKRIHDLSRDVFRNFAKYLVDFFRFSRVDKKYVERFVKIEGLENIDKGLSAGKGAIALSAHIGNWELGGLILSLLRGPMHAVVLTHQDKNVNKFFIGQRTMGKVKPIEIGFALRRCYTVLKSNGLLAMLGDRDFSKNGVEAAFFGKKTLIPKGPAVLSHRLGACIVPSFMIRSPDNTFRFIFEAPIFPDKEKGEVESVSALIGRYLSIIESYVRRYPTQWYMFREVWNGDQRNIGPDTVI